MASTKEIKRKISDYKYARQLQEEKLHIKKAEISQAHREDNHDRAQYLGFAASRIQSVIERYDARIRFFQRLLASDVPSIDLKHQREIAAQRGHIEGFTGLPEAYDKDPISKIAVEDAEWIREKTENFEFLENRVDYIRKLRRLERTMPKSRSYRQLLTDIEHFLPKRVDIETIVQTIVRHINSYAAEWVLPVTEEEHVAFINNTTYVYDEGVHELILTCPQEFVTDNIDRILRNATSNHNLFMVLGGDDDFYVQHIRMELLTEVYRELIELTRVLERETRLAFEQYILVSN